MPVKDGYEYADTPHEKTVAGLGYQYGCHSDKLGSHKRCEVGMTDGQFGWEQIGYTADGKGIRMVAIRKPYQTKWMDVACGHLTRGVDAACEGCANRTR